MKYILETDRLALREFNENDADFIVNLVNSEGWLKYIGDKNIKSTDQARGYLVNGPLKSYTDNGFGLSLVELKKDKSPIGMCGIINRDSLEHPDIGFAFLPGYSGQGYGYEISKRTLQYAIDDLKLTKIVAITVPENIASIKLLEKLGLRFEKNIKAQNDTTDLLLFGTA